MNPADIAEADRIKDRIRKATNADEMRAVVDAERAAVQALSSNPETAVLAVQIKNLKDYVMRVAWAR